jgi:putative transposase
MRPLRKTIPGATYHITARTNRKEPFLAAPAAKDLFVEMLARAKRKYLFAVDNFVVMDNHIHLMIRPEGKSSLSLIMKWIMGVYAMKHNRLYAHWGHVWGDRYFSRPVVSLREYVAVYQYIDNNPTSAGLADDRLVWPWSGAAHQSLGRTDVLGSDPVFGSFS